MNEAPKIDMCLPCGDGIINIRVGAIILRDNHFLMVKNRTLDYFYSVGGRIQFGETAQEAVVREVFEETGAKMEIDHLGFIQENYFIADNPSLIGKEVYELGYYFYMKVPEDFEPICKTIAENGQTEYLEWISPHESKTVYPSFFKTQLNIKDTTVKHLIKDDRFYIRHMTDSDIEPLYNLLSNPDVMKYLEEPFTYKRTEDFLKTQGLTSTPRIQAVEDKNHLFIGYVIYHDYDKDSKEIGWVLKKDKWGQGFANLLTKQLIIKAFSEGKDVVIECVPEQEATRKIAKRNNFTLIGKREGLDVYQLNRKAQ